jgi:hypothetical protein
VLQVSNTKSSFNDDDATSKQYKLEEIATVWDSLSSVTASIAEDDVVKKGNKLIISVLVQSTDGSLIEAEKSEGGFS